MHVIGDMGRFAAEVLSRIERARRRVEVECFIIRDDRLGRLLAAALSAAAQRGVCCRLIYDPLGCRWTPADFFRAIAGRGVAVRRYGWLGSALVGRPGARDHARLVIVDEAVAYTGGHAWGEEWLPARDGGRGWRDVCCRVDGAVVEDFSRLFQQHWQEAAGDARIRDYDSGMRPGSVRLISDAPVRPSVILGRYVEAVSRARRRVWLANAYFYPPPALLGALAAACRRGVEVKVIVPGRSDLPLIQRAGRWRYSGKSRVSEARVRRSRPLGLELGSPRITVTPRASRPAATRALASQRGRARSSSSVVAREASSRPCARRTDAVPAQE